MTETEVRKVPTTIAVCSCGEPLVLTFLFPYKEFICLEDGRLYEFLEPERVDVTPGLWERFVVLDAEFKELMRDAIPKEHAGATEAQRRASDAAFSALHRRIGGA